METICAIFDFFSAFRHDFFFPANNFEAQIFLVIKNTQVVSCVLCSSFMQLTWCLDKAIQKFEN